MGVSHNIYSGRRTFRHLRRGWDQSETKPNRALCCSQSMGKARISWASDRPAGSSPLRIASMMSGASVVSFRIRNHIGVVYVQVPRQIRNGAKRPSPSPPTRRTPGPGLEPRPSELPVGYPEPRHPAPGGRRSSSGPASTGCASEYESGDCRSPSARGWLRAHRPWPRSVASLAKPSAR